MCGILGVFEKNDTVKKDCFLNSLEKMNHRGPNATGFFIDGKIGLGHKRLSIVDLSNTANQPFFNKDKSQGVVFNGEIYNHKDIRKNLKKLYTFQTNSDTEVLLNSIDAYGIDALNMFNGMWAFIHYNKDKEEFLISRDRFGIKPLYYYEDKTKLIFSSEIKSILEYLNKIEINYQAVWNFLNFGYQDGDMEETFIKGIRRFPKGSYAKINFSSGIPIFSEIKSFYNLPTNQKSLEKHQLYQKFESLLRDAINIRVPDEVKSGISLSGGLDSSTIAYHLKDKNIETFTVAYGNGEYSEEKEVKKICSFLDIQNFVVKPQNENFIEIMREIMYFLEEPSSHHSIFSQWFVMKKAGENGCKVLLDGQGADEYLGGYHTYIYAKIFSSFVDFFKRNISFKNLINELRGIKEKTNKGIFFYTLLNLRKKRNYIIFPKKWKNIAKQEWLEYLKPLPIFKLKFKGDLLNKILAKSLLQNSLPGLLRDEDKIAMKYSIENRVPFLDHRLVELMFSQSNKYKIKDGWTKWILRKVMDNKLPDEIIWDKRKRGYPTPIDDYLSENNEEICNLLLDKNSFISSLFDKNKFENWLSKKPNKGDLWRVFQVEIWYQTFIK